MYPQGATEQAVLDMAGNIGEWCLNTDENPEQPKEIRIVKAGGGRVRRGGAWFGTPVDLRASTRDGNFAVDRNSLIGFRLVQDIP